MSRRRALAEASTLQPLLAVAMFLGMGLLSLVPRVARAWTDATVRSVHVTIGPEPGGEGTRYALRAEVHVRGGWLDGIALTGFDEPMRWDEPAPSLRVLPTKEALAMGGSLPSRSGRFWALHPERSRAQWWLRLEGPRVRRPHRGRYLLRAQWLGPPLRGLRDGEHSESLHTWTLPPWRAGLEDVRIAIALPRDARAEKPNLPGASFSWRRDGETRWAVWRRSQLPRATPWTVRWRTAGNGGGLPSRGTGPRAAAAVQHDAVSDAARSPHATLPARLAAMLALVQWAFGLLWMRRRGLRPAPLLPWPRDERLRGGVSCLLTAWSWYHPAPSASLGAIVVVLLVWRRPPGLLRRPAAGWRPLRPEEARRLDRLGLLFRLVGLGPWDPTRPLGRILWLAASGWMLLSTKPATGAGVETLLSWLPWLLAPWADTASRHPTPVALRWRLLRRIAGASAWGHRAWRPMALVDRHGRVHAVRLRSTEAERLELHVMDALTHGGRRPVAGALLWPRHEWDDVRVRRRLASAERLPWPDPSRAPWWTTDLGTLLGPLSEPAHPASARERRSLNFPMRAVRPAR